MRDALLGLEHLDWDLATAATPQQVRRLFKRTIPVGIEFGTVGVLDKNGRMHEVTTFRRDVRTDGRHAVVEFGASLDEDLARRDFTINAIAYDPITKQLHDPFDGQKDLEKGIVRAVGVAQDRLREDRLRALRAIRFASRFNFEIEAKTWQAIEGSSPHLTRLSPERVKQEIDKTLEQVALASRAFVRWRNSGAFAAVVPALRNVDDSTLAAVDCLPKPGLAVRPLRRMLRMAALMSELERKEVVSALRSLRASNQEVTVVSDLVGYWQQYGDVIAQDLRAGRLPADSALRRLAAGIGRLRVNAFVRLAAAHWAQDSAINARDVRMLFRRFTWIAFNHPIEVADLAIDGDDLRRVGVAPGPALGDTLRYLVDAVVENPSLNTREALLKLVGERVQQPSAVSRL